MSIDLTADERSYADGPQGRSQIACARAHHERSQANKGPYAQPWTGALEAQAARDLAKTHRWEDN